MEPTVLTTDMMIVFGLLSLAIILFVFDLLRVDLVGISMMVLLPLTGVLKAEEALAGLSSNAVVSIIAVMIIGAGLNKTGVMNVIASQIIKVAGKNENRNQSGNGGHGGRGLRLEYVHTAYPSAQRPHHVSRRLSYQGLII